MTTKDRIEKIAMAKANRDFEAQRAAEERTRRIEEVRKFFLQYSDRIKALLEVADAVQKNGFTLGKIKGYLAAHPEFVSDGIDHKFGFVTNGNQYFRPYNLPLLGVGCEGGGASGPDIIITEHGLRTQHEYESYKRFVEHFDERFCDFEKRFYEYVDSLCRQYQ